MPGNMLYFQPKECVVILSVQYETVYLSKFLNNTDKISMDDEAYSVKTCVACLVD